MYVQTLTAPLRYRLLHPTTYSLSPFGFLTGNSNWTGAKAKLDSLLPLHPATSSMIKKFTSHTNAQTTHLVVDLDSFFFQMQSTWSLGSSTQNMSPIWPFLITTTATIWSSVITWTESQLEPLTGISLLLFIHLEWPFKNISQILLKGFL